MHEGILLVINTSIESLIIVAICLRCRTGFDAEIDANCPACGAYWSRGPRSGAPVGSGLILSVTVPFLCGLLVSLLSRSLEVLTLGITGSILCLYVWSIFWSYADGKARGKPGFLVAIIVALFSWPLGLLLWIVFRP